MTASTAKRDTLTPVMRACLVFMHQGDGSIYRHQGGYWCSRIYNLAESFGTSTVEGLVKRGFIEYVEWKEGRNGKFPTRATVAYCGIKVGRAMCKKPRGHTDEHVFEEDFL